MGKFREGQRVRVNMVGTVERFGTGNTEGQAWISVQADGSPFGQYVPLKFVEAIDDPSSDPVGTVRRDPESGEVVLLQEIVSPWPWTNILAPVGGARSHSDVQGWPIIGSAPGTPAAEGAE